MIIWYFTKQFLLTLSPLLQEAAEISEFQNERKQMSQKIHDLSNTVAVLKNEKCELQQVMEDINAEKTTILDNSVAEITQLQVRWLPSRQL